MRAALQLLVAGAQSRKFGLKHAHPVLAHSLRIPRGQPRGYRSGGAVGNGADVSGTQQMDRWEGCALDVVGRVGLRRQALRWAGLTERRARANYAWAMPARPRLFRRVVDGAFGARVKECDLYRIGWCDLIHFRLDRPA